MNSQEILQAIEIIANSKIENLKFDKTIEANITNVVDYSTGEYQISYNGNTFNVFSSNGTIYEIGDTILVKIPEGDFSKTKTIEGKPGGYVSSSQMLEYIPQGEPINNIYNIDNQRIGLAAGGTQLLTIWDRGSQDLTSADTLFSNYAKNFDKIKISANFQTLLKGTHTKGNYGIIVYFGQRNFENDNEIIEEVAYRLDTNNFTGGVYSFQNPSPQEIVIGFQKGTLISLKKIDFFIESFEPDYYSIWNTELEKMETEINLNPSLFVSNINISFIEEKDYSKEPYYLSISTPSGTSVRKGYDIVLVPNLKYYGRNILSNSTCKWKWYEQTINEEHKTIWQEVNHYESGSNINLKITNNDVVYKTLYKFEITYNNNITLTEEIVVYNNSNKDIYYNIIQDNNILKLSSNAENIPTISWYYYNLNQEIEKIAEDTLTIDISSYLKQPLIEFFCDVKGVTVLNKTIGNLTSNEDIAVVFKGIDKYQYDINGDFNIDEAQLQRKLEATVILSDGFATGYKSEWVVPEENTMIREYQISEGVLYYKVKQKFSNRDINNTIQYKITAIDGTEYIFDKEILFLKDGDQAVIGNTYSCIVRPLEDSNIALNYNKGVWGEEMSLQATVYKGNEEIVDNIVYEWVGIGVSCEGSGSRININGTADPNNSVQFIVKLKATINNDIVVYYNYPVDIIIGDTIDESKLNINLPNQIIYSASGVSANHTSEPVKVFYDQIEVTNNLSAANKLLTIKDKDGERYVEPISSFSYSENETGVLYCQLTDSSLLLHPVMMSLDTTGKESLDGWDGTQIQVNENTTITAPQAGSSTVNENKTITGVILGTENKKTNAEKTSSTGLYGYKDGVNTFALKEDGTATFGTEDKGQIIINGDNSKISGNSSNPEENMILYLVKPTSGMAITVGSYFKVRYDGSIDAQEGKIGALILKNGVLSTEDNHTVINDNGISAKQFSIIEDDGDTAAELGFFKGNDGVNSTDVIGISSEDRSIVLESNNKNARITAQDTYLQAKESLTLKDGKWSVTLDQIINAINNLAGDNKPFK